MKCIQCEQERKIDNLQFYNDVGYICQLCSYIILNDKTGKEYMALKMKIRDKKIDEILEL